MKAIAVTAKTKVILAFMALQILTPAAAPQNAKSYHALVSGQ